MGKALADRSMWAITGVYNGRQFFYTGTYLTRRDAIRDHAQAKGRTWDACYARGDRAVRVEVRLIEAERGRNG